MFLNCCDQCTCRNACLTAWADGAHQPVVMLAFQPGATVLIRLSASEVARCALQDRMHQQQATSLQMAWKQNQQYACARLVLGTLGAGVQYACARLVWVQIQVQLGKQIPTVRVLCWDNL